MCDFEALLKNYWGEQLIHVEVNGNSSEISPFDSDTVRFLQDVGVPTRYYELSEYLRLRVQSNFRTLALMRDRSMEFRYPIPPGLLSAICVGETSARILCLTFPERSICGLCPVDESILFVNSSFAKFLVSSTLVEKTLAAATGRPTSEIQMLLDELQKCLDVCDSTCLSRRDSFWREIVDDLRYEASKVE